MTIIRAHCPACHRDVELTPGEVILRLGPGPTAGYRFICRECLARVDHPANPRLVSVLMSIGVPILQISIEAVTAVPDARDPITEGEALDFAIALAGTDVPQAELLIE